MSKTSPSAITTDEHWIDHSCGKLFARRWRATPTGDAAPLVLFHDSLGCVALWRDFPALLCAASGRDIIAYDRLGFGQSDACTHPLSLTFVEDEAALFLPSLISHFGLERFVAVGHSVGGGMAVHAAARFPTRCVGLVTESAQAWVGPETVAGIRSAAQAFADPGQFSRLQKYHGRRARWVLDAWIETWLDPLFTGWSLDAALPSVQCPLLAIHGQLDEYGSPEHPAHLADSSGGPAQVHILPANGHVPHRERAGEVTRLVAQFLATLA